MLRAISRRGISKPSEKAGDILILENLIDGLAQGVGHERTAVSHRLRRPRGRVTSGLVLQLCVKFSTDNQYDY